MPRLILYRAAVTLGPAIRGHVYSFDPIAEATYSRPDERADDTPPLPFRTMECIALAVEIPRDAKIRTLPGGFKFLTVPDDPVALLDAAGVIEKTRQIDGGFALVP